MAAALQIIDRLKCRWVDLTTVTGSDCAACGDFGAEYTYDDYACVGATDEAERVLTEIAQTGSSSLRECRRCGSLFVQDAFSLAAADNLFATASVRLRRISPLHAIQLLRATEIT